MTRFEGGQGAQFETFAMQRVRGAMLDELRSADWLPRSVRRNQRAIERAIRAAEQRLRRAPGEAEIAAELGVDLREYQQMLADARGAQLVHLDDFGDEDDEVPDRNAPAGRPIRRPSSVTRASGTLRRDRAPARERLVMACTTSRT